MAAGDASENAVVFVLGGVRAPPRARAPPPRPPAPPSWRR